MMKTGFNHMLLLCIAIALTFNVSSVHAKKDTMEDSYAVTFIAPPTFYIKSNGQQYTGISQQTQLLTFWQLPAQFVYQTNGDDRIKSYHLQLRMKWTTAGKTEIFTGSDVEKSYPATSRPKSVNEPVSFSLSANEIESFFVNACNATADGFRNIGQNNNQIFSNVHNVYAKLYASHAIDLYSPPTAGEYNPPEEKPDQFVKIVCMKAPAPTVDTPDGFIQESEVTDATLYITEQSTLGGSCKVKLTTVIKTNLPDTTVRYRYEHINGKKSDLNTVTTNYVKTDISRHWYDVPDDPNKAEAGSIRIIGVSHDFQSAWKSYNMSCHAKGPSGLSVVTKPTVKLDIVPIDNITHEGMICPTKVKIIATLSSAKAFSGTGKVTMTSRGLYSFESHDVNLSPNTPWKHDETFILKPWSTVNAPAGMAGGSNTFQNQPGTNNTAPFQRLQVRYNLNANQKSVISTPYKTVSIRCRPAKFNPTLPGSGTVGINKPQPVSSANNKKSVNAGLRSDGELVQAKKPKSLLGHELIHNKQQQGKPKARNATSKWTGSRPTLYTGKLLKRCKPDQFPKNAVIKQAGRQHVVECFRGKVKINKSRKVIKAWKKGDPVYPNQRK